jgi:NTP pyrophosphatase (non-canonical NTP hydrolase)
VDFASYQRLALRTCAQSAPEYDLHELGRLGTLGELGELAELLKKEYYHQKPIDQQNLIKETGDVLWYLAIYAEAQGVSLGSYEAQAQQTQQLSPIQHALAITNHLPQLPVDQLGLVLSHLGAILQHYGSSLHQAMEQNIEKLRKRYPDGFDYTIAQTHNSQ